MKIITYKQFDNAINKQVNDNIDEFGISQASCTIQDNCKDIILGVWECEKQLEVVDNWRDIVKTKGKVT